MGERETRAGGERLGETSRGSKREHSVLEWRETGGGGGGGEREMSETE